MKLIIPAAGKGNRFKHVQPKQYTVIEGKTVLEHCLARFEHIKEINEILIPISQEDEQFQQLRIQDPRVRNVIGGQTRFGSVACALEAISDTSNPWIMIHDAARCCVHPHDIAALIASLPQAGDGIILSNPVVDTLKEIAGHTIKATHLRDYFRLALTPQVFRLDVLRAAFAYCASKKITPSDEAQAVEMSGGAVNFLDANWPNPKLTFEHQMSYFSVLLKRLD